MLYQLSYSRVRRKCNGSVGFYLAQPGPLWDSARPAPSGGEGDRTPDLVNAIHALSQLSYSPTGPRRLPGAIVGARSGRKGWGRRSLTA